MTLFRPARTPSATALRAWFRVTMSPSPWPRRSRGSAPGTAGFRRVKKVAVDSGMPTPCRAGGTIDLFAAGHLHREKHERHELKNDVDHGRHVDVLVTFLGSFAAEQHVDQPSCGERRGIVR